MKITPVILALSAIVGFVQVDALPGLLIKRSSSNAVAGALDSPSDSFKGLPILDKREVPSPTATTTEAPHRPHAHPKEIHTEPHTPTVSPHLGVHSTLTTTYYTSPPSQRPTDGPGVHDKREVHPTTLPVPPAPKPQPHPSPAHNVHDKKEITSKIPTTTLYTTSSAHLHAHPTNA